MQEYPIPDPEVIVQGTRAQRAQAVRTGLGQSPWLNAVAVYLDTLYNLSDIRYAKVLRISRLLQQMCDPALGTVSGLEMLMELIQKLEQQIRISTGPIIRRMDEVDYDEPTAAYKGKISKATFSISKYFKKVHDSEILNYVGYDFLGGRNRKSIGPRLITPEQLQRRANTENSKFFNVEYEDLNQAPPVTSGDADEEASERSATFTSGMDLQDKFYSYLTPQKISFGKGNNLVISPSRKMFAPKQYTNLISTILACSPNVDASSKTLQRAADPKNRFSKFRPPISFGLTDKSENIEMDTDTFASNIAGTVVLGKLGISISTPVMYDTKMEVKDFQQGLEEEERGNQDPRDVLGQDTKFWTDPLEVEDLNDTDAVLSLLEEQEELTEINNTLIAPIIRSNASANIFPSESRIKGIQELNPLNEENMIDKYFAKRPLGEQRKGKFVQRQPNQIKSLFLASAETGTRRKWFDLESNRGVDLFVSPKHAGVLYFLYNHINGIEVMTGYRRDASGNVNVSRPIFELMSKAIFDDIKKNGSTYLCRMVPYSDSLLQLGKSDKLSLPEFDSFFFIGPRTRVPSGTDNTTTANQSSPATAATLQATTENVFVNRLTEYAPMNDTGRKVLTVMVRNSTHNDGLPTEYASTALIQQPTTTTRVGTNFTSEETPPPMAPTESQVATALRDRAAARQSTGPSPSRQTTSPGPTPSRSSGGGGGGY